MRTTDNKLYIKKRSSRITQTLVLSYNLTEIAVFMIFILTEIRHCNMVKQWGCVIVYAYYQYNSAIIYPCGVHIIFDTFEEAICRMHLIPIQSVLFKYIILNIFSCSSIVSFHILSPPLYLFVLLRNFMFLGSHSRFACICTAIIL